MTSSTQASTTLEKILDLARWAPSGDNEQCWRFEIVADDRVVVHGYDTRDHCVYDLDGSASQIGLGALLETMTIAASRWGLRVDAKRRVDSPVEQPLIDVRFVPDPGVAVDLLIDQIERRSVFRRALGTRALSDAQKQALVASIGPSFELHWRETSADRRRMARLLFNSAKLRLTIPEAYEVHRVAIEWGARYSVDRVPEEAVGLDRMTALLMRWVMRSWGRVTFFNRFLGGTIAPRIQLDFIPAIRCAAHFALVARESPTTIDDFIAAGRAVQRLWLTVASLGLQLQPEVTPIIFARYSRHETPFSATRGALRAAGRIEEDLAREFGDEVRRAVFMGRIGHGKNADARSLRLPLEQLMFDPTRPMATQKLRRSST
jgi:hypothetical protein